MPEQLPDINLLPEHERDTSFLFPLFIGLVVLTLLLYGFFLYQYITSKKHISAAEEEEAGLIEEEASLSAKLSELDGDDVTTVKGIADFLDTQDIHTSIFVDEMNELLPDNSYLANYDYAVNEATMTIHVETLDDVAAYTDRVKQSEYTRDVKVDDISIFKPVDHGEGDDIYSFAHIPRYEANFTILVNKQAIKGEQEGYE